MSDLNILLLIVLALLPAIALNLRERYDRWRLRRQLRYSQFPTRTPSEGPVYRGGPL